MSSPISTHVLDTTRGKPAGKMPVTLEKHALTDGWKTLAKGITSADGRANELLPGDAVLERGVYRLTFDAGSYFKSAGVVSFFPLIEVVFEVSDPTQRYHIPLLLSPFGYSTYRGS